MNFFEDNPRHNTPILAGLWGFAIKRNRLQAKELFKILTDKSIAKRYNLHRNKLYGRDQSFLSDFFFSFALKNSTTHDSFFCEKYGGMPFPTQRPKGNCYLGCHHCCLPNYQRSKFGAICPEKCRPPEHQDWLSC